MWENQSGRFTTSKKVNIDFLWLELSVTKIGMCKLHVDESSNGIYDMILSRDLLTALGLDIKFSKNVNIGG